MQRIAERFEQDGSSTDPTVRGQIQEELVQVGLRMQHFGALLLDLGSSILTLRLEQSTVSLFLIQFQSKIEGGHRMSEMSIPTCFIQIDLQDVALRVVSSNCPMDVFRAMVESSARISGSSTDDIANELCTHHTLAQVQFPFILPFNLCTLV